MTASQQSENKKESALTEIFRQLGLSYREKWETENRRKLRDWWPVSGKFTPPQLEIAAGAILTQNTGWRNVERALEKMEKEGLLDAATIAGCGARKLGRVIRPAGFFAQKAGTLKALCRLVLEFDGDFCARVTREQLLGIKGIGKETADSILLYACGRPEFVVDAYTWRIFGRYGMLKKGMKHGEIKEFFESRLPRDAKLYREFHALIVEHAKQTCRKKPLCELCPLSAGCRKVTVQ